MLGGCGSKVGDEVSAPQSHDLLGVSKLAALFVCKSRVLISDQHIKGPSILNLITFHCFVDEPIVRLARGRCGRCP